MWALAFFSEFHYNKIQEIFFATAKGLKTKVGKEGKGKMRESCEEGLQFQL